MKIVGITGSIASGKSTVTAMLRESGFQVFDADEAVHKIYELRNTVEFFKQNFPTTVENGRVNRTKLSEVLRFDPKNFTTLEKYIHPLVQQMREQFLSQALAKGEHLVFADVPLLFETERDNDYDAIIFVDAPEHLRTERALKRPGMTREKLDMIFKRQLPDATKAKKSDYVLDNSGEINDLQRQIKTVVRKLNVNNDR